MSISENSQNNFSSLKNKQIIFPNYLDSNYLINFALLLFIDMVSFLFTIYYSFNASFRAYSFFLLFASFNLTTLNKLHLVIQNSFNWWNYHLFQFIGHGKSKTIETVFKNKKELMYEYDFGTTQYHLIKKVKSYKFSENDAHKVLPVCIEGSRFAPFEDSSDWDYMLEIAQDKKHEEYKETIDWLEEMWDQTTEGEQGKFSVSKLLDNKVGLLEINVELSRLQLYPTKEYKEFDIPTSMKSIK